MISSTPTADANAMAPRPGTANRLRATLTNGVITVGTDVAGMSASSATRVVVVVAAEGSVESVGGGSDGNVVPELVCEPDDGRDRGP